MGKKGKIVHWDTEPPPGNPGDGGMKQVQKQVQLRFASKAPDSVATALPSKRTHVSLDNFGNYRAKQHPGAE